MTEDDSLKDLKESGYIFQKDSEHFTVRLRIPGGDLTSEQLMAVGKIAQDWGKSEIHITTRQGIEVPWIRFDDLKEVTRTLDEVGTPPGSCGPRVRNVSSCVGLPRCTQALADSRKLARKIDERFFNVVLPTKLKIAVSACPNSCAKPQVNDLGVVAVAQPRIDPDRCDACGKCVRACKEGAIKAVDGVPRIDYASCINCGDCVRACPLGAIVVGRTGYTVYVGGNVGRHPRLAHKLMDFADEETVFRVFRNAVALIEDECERGERFGHLIERLGLGASLSRLLS
jgi:dissimilatory sulfite reductase (desulfoviridin) alpha/beta subunit